MKKIWISLTCLLCCASLLTACAFLPKTPDSKEPTPSRTETVEEPTENTGEDWSETLRRELLSGESDVEQQIAEKVQFTETRRSEDGLVVKASAPDIYDSLTQWYEQLPTEERTEEAVQEKIRQELETAEPTEKSFTLPFAGEKTLYTEEFLQFISCGLRRFLQRIGWGDGFAFCGEAAQIDFAAIEHKILLQTLEQLPVYDMKWDRQDADGDGRKELFLEIAEMSAGRQTQLLLDTDTESFWAYTATGAAQFTSFLLVDGQWVFEDTYATAGTELYCLKAWDGAKWSTFAECRSESTVDANGNFVPVVSVSQWRGTDKSYDEFFALWEQHSEVPVYSSPALGMQSVLGDWEALVEQMDRYLTENHTCAHFERTDFSGDGVEDCIFLLKGAANRWLEKLSYENAWGTEALPQLREDVFTVVGLEQTDEGANITVSRVLCTDSTYYDNIDEHFSVDDQGRLCFSGGERLFYSPALGCFVWDEDLSGMEEPTAEASDELILLNLFGIPLEDSVAYVDPLNAVNSSTVRGDVGTAELIVYGSYEGGLDYAAVCGFCVIGGSDISIDGKLRTSMTRSQIWEKIANTEMPWMEVDATQEGYATSIYYTKPESGIRYRIDIFFDSDSPDAGISGIYADFA